ncbi:MAG: response regulator, partial [Pseudomonadota bacterium]
DTATNRMVADLMLSAVGHNVVAATGGEDALAQIAAGPFDLVLMDIQMPDLDGLSALKRIRRSGQSWSNLPVIAMTADAMPEKRAHYLGAGMTGYVAKPVDRRALLDEIDRVIARHRAPETQIRSA